MSKFYTFWPSHYFMDWEITSVFSQVIVRYYWHLSQAQTRQHARTFIRYLPLLDSTFSTSTLARLSIELLVGADSVSCRGYITR